MLVEGGWWGCWQGGRQAREEGREGDNDMGGNVMKIIELLKKLKDFRNLPLEKTVILENGDAQLQYC